MTTYQPGSFFLAAAEGWAGYGIALGQALAGDASRWTHAGLILDSEGTCVEAEPGGARYGKVTAYRHTLVSDAPIQEELAQYDRGELHWYETRNDLEQYLRREVTYQAHGLVGIGYSFLDYAAIGLLHLHLPSTWVRKRVQSSGHMLCSQLVDACYSRAGIELFDDGRLPGDVAPADLAAWAEDHSA